MFSKKTYIYGLLLVISASFTFQIYKFFEVRLGVSTIQSIIYTCFLIVGVTLVIYGIKIKPTILQILYLSLAFLMSLAIIRYSPFLAEKTHILSYGLLGYLSTSDLIKKNFNSIKSIFFSFVFGLGINVSDELFQGLLPYRFGEIRDVVINIVCTIIGILIFFGFNKKEFAK